MSVYHRQKLGRLTAATCEKQLVNVNEAVEKHGSGHEKDHLTGQNIFISPMAHPKKFVTAVCYSFLPTPKHPARASPCLYEIPDVASDTAPVVIPPHTPPPPFFIFPP